MECRFRDLKIEFPLELLQILDLGMEMSFGEHPSYWVKAVIPDEKADSYVSSITENSELKVSIVKKDSIKVIFCGYTTSVEVCSKAGYYVATIRAIAYTAKMDIEKKSRSFFKKGVTYHQILEEVIKDYPNTQMKEMVQTKRVTDFPILQYQETDWEFIKRIASMYEVVVTPVCTESFPRFYIGKPESVKTKFLDKQATETFRDLGTCYQDYFKEMQSFSIPKLDAQKKLQEEMEKQAKELERKLEELSKNEESKGMVAAEDQTGEEAFLQMLSALFLSKGSDGEEMIVSAMDSSMEEDQAALTPMDSMEALGGMSGTVDTIGEMNFTFFSFESRKFYPLGSMVTLPNDMTLMVTHVECYVYKEEVFYEYIVREASGVTAIYEHNRRLAGVSLLGTIKKRVGNTVSINLDIDQDDGYKSAQEDYFFAYALETKDYYCMPVEGARVHLYFPTGMEWEAIAIHSMRMEKDHSSKRAAKIQNPDNNSLSNDFGVSLDLTPNHINFTPHDANSVFIKLEKNGDITIEGQDITISAKNINLGKTAPSSIVDDGGSEVTCKNLSLTASKVLYATRCTGGEEPAPIEDHFVGLNEYAQLYSTEKIKHITTGAPKAPSVSYDESDLRTKEAEQIKEQNESVEKALIDRKNAGIAQLGRGLFIAAVGVAIVAATVLTGGAALAPLVAVVGNTAAGVIGGVIGTGMAIYGSSQMQEGLSNINLADAGDFSTPADNYLKEKMGEPLYSIMGNGFVIAGSIITGGALGVSAGSILFVGGVTTGVSMVFDYCDNGRLDMGPLDYLNSFSTTCLITSLTGPLAKKFGNCNTFKGRFAGRFVQQMSASTLYALTSGQLDLMHMGENMVRELLSSLVAAAIPVQGPWAEQMGNKLKYITGAVDMTMDGILDSAAQIFENKMSGDPNAKFDYKRLAQTLIISAIFNFKFSADPVNCARGNLYCFREDLSYEDLYGEFTFKRRYDSMLDYQGTMGMGWLHEYDSMLIVEESKNTIHIVMPDGHKETFIRQQDQSWLNQNSKTRVYELIEGREECCFELVSRENGEYRRYRYEYDGRLTQISYDPYALRKTHITYRSEQELSTANTNARRKYPEIETITSPGGRVLRFHYKNGALTSVTDDSGRCVRYEYENGCLVKAYYPSGGIQTYIYDENRRLVTMSGEDGRDFITNQYDAKGRVVRQHYPDGNFCKIEYDDVKRISTFTFSDTGRIERYYYNKMLQIEKTEYLSGPSLQEEIVENSDKNIRKTIYGRGSRPEVSVAKEEAQVILDAVETCIYDDMGNKIEETDRNGNTIYRTYDAFGNVLEEQLPNGLVRCKKYDNLYHLVHEWDNAGAEKVYEYDSQGNQTAIIEKVSQGKVAVTHFSYDEYKRVITKTDPNGNVTKYAYDGFSTKNHSYVFTPSGEQFSYQYDSAGRRSSVTTTYGTAKFEYSETGVLTRTTDALGNTTRRYVDAAGNVLKLIPPNLYSGKYQQVEGYAYEYDYLDRLVKTIYPDGTVEAQNVDMDGNVVKVIHPNGYDENTNDGYGVTYEYDSCQYKVKETTAEGYTTRYKYDANGNVIKLIQPEDYDPVTDDGKGIQYEYDSGNRLTAILDENGVYVRKLVYDLAGRLVKDINGEGYAYGSTDEERYGILYSYNALGWLTEKREPVSEQDGVILYNLTRYDYDLCGNRIQEQRSCDYVDKKGYPASYLTISFTYDQENRLIKVEDSLGAAMEYTYDCLNNKLSERARINEKKYRQKYFSYDACGRLSEVKEALDFEDLGLAKKAYVEKVLAVTKYAYDANGNVTDIVTPEGYQVHREYDMRDRVVCETFTDKKNGVSKKVTYEYDKVGNLVVATDGLGASELWTYDKSDRILSRIDKAGHKKCYRYDRNGRLVKVMDGDQYDVSKQDGAGTSYAYDSFGRILSVRNALGYLEEQNQYDRAGNLLERSDETGVLARFTYDIGGRTTSVTNGSLIENEQEGVSQKYAYDAMGHVVGVVDGEQNHTHFELDEWGRVTGITKPDGSRETYTYDYAGNVTSTTDGLGHTISYEYNTMNKLGVITDQEGNKEYLAYDKQGRMTGHIDRDGRKVRFGYNGLDNVVLKHAQDTGELYSYGYNEEGQLIRADGGGVCYTYEYTPDGKVKTKYRNGVVALRYQYNSMGLVSSIQDMSGKKTEYGYDVLGRVTEVRDQGKVLVQYGYSKDNNLASARFANGVVTEYEYDQDKNVKTLETRDSKGNVLMTFAYAYDGNGNRTVKDGMQEQKASRTEYHYDCMQRVEKTMYPGGNWEQFRYDAAGNREERLTGTWRETYAYDVRNRLVEKASHDVITKYTYDRQGNTVREDTTSLALQGKVLKEVAYEYNGFNQAVRTRVQEDVFANEAIEKRIRVQENFYDAENFRYGIMEDGKRTDFISNGWDAFNELDQDGNVERRLVRGYGMVAAELVTGTDARVAWQYCYYHQDEHGDVRYITGEDASVKNRYAYDAFGCQTQADEIIRNRYRYNGEMYDGVTEQYYLRARFYNPSVARFTQEDVYRGDGLNLYAYCGNNAVGYEDPSGYDGQKCQTNSKGEKKSSKLPEWLKALFDAGNNFNKENRPRYLYNEVEVYGEGKNYVVDSYIPDSEIVSRKYTQLGDVKESTGIGYLNELARKYPSGAIITDSPFNPKILRGKTMTGDLILEIPVQKKPIPQGIINAANEKGIVIRDVNGKEYN